MKKILITNDDGINSEGIKALERILKPLGQVYVVAPSQERSAAAHSISFNHPLRINKISKYKIAVDGTPSDCVMFGVYGLFKHKRPDLLVSGINHGVNLGDDITYSGTVSAALEGTLLKVPSIAISIVRNGKFKFFAASKFIKSICRSVMDNKLPENTFLNINIPNSYKIKGIRVVRQGKRIYKDKMIKKIDPRGKTYYWLGGKEPSFQRIKDCDFEAIENGMISITPLHYDLTNYGAIKETEALLRIKGKF